MGAWGLASWADGGVSEFCVEGESDLYFISVV